MNLYRKTVSLLLLFSLLQAFAPVVRMVSEASCCMAAENAASSQGCCKKAQASMQMQCCPGEASPSLQPTVPPLTKKILPLLSEPLARITTTNLFARSEFEFDSLSSFNSHLSNNQRYLLSSALLI